MGERRQAQGTPTLVRRPRRVSTATPTATPTVPFGLVTQRAEATTSLLGSLGQGMRTLDAAMQQRADQRSRQAIDQDMLDARASSTAIMADMERVIAESEALPDYTKHADRVETALRDRATAGMQGLQTFEGRRAFETAINGYRQQTSRQAFDYMRNRQTEAGKATITAAEATHTRGAIQSWNDPAMRQFHRISYRTTVRSAEQEGFLFSGDAEQRLLTFEQNVLAGDLLRLGNLDPERMTDHLQAQLRGEPGVDGWPEVPTAMALKYLPEAQTLWRKQLNDFDNAERRRDAAQDEEQADNAATLISQIYATPVSPRAMGAYHAFRTEMQSLRETEAISARDLERISALIARRSERSLAPDMAASDPEVLRDLSLRMATVTNTDEAIQVQGEFWESMSSLSYKDIQSFSTKIAALTDKTHPFSQPAAQSGKRRIFEYFNIFGDTMDQLSAQGIRLATEDRKQLYQALNAFDNWILEQGQKGNAINIIAQQADSKAREIIQGMQTSTGTTSKTIQGSRLPDEIRKAATSAEFTRALDAYLDRTESNLSKTERDARYNELRREWLPLWEMEPR